MTKRANGEGSVYQRKDGRWVGSMSAQDHRLHALFVVLLVLGLRRSEALGLRWSDVDVDGRAMHIRHSLHREADGLVLLPPKTRRSRRTIPLPALVAEALAKHRERQESERKALGSDWSETGHVFTTTIGTPIDPRNCSRIFMISARPPASRPWPLHALRRTCVSLLLSMSAGPGWSWR